jgi:hypothetical protein
MAESSSSADGGLSGADISISGAESLLRGTDKGSSVGASSGFKKSCETTPDVMVEKTFVVPVTVVVATVAAEVAATVVAEASFVGVNIAGADAIPIREEEGLSGIGGAGW